MSPAPTKPGCYSRRNLAGMTERAAPFYCPYCAEENIRPFGEKHGEWRCGGCQRVFRLGYVGLAADWIRPVRVAEEQL
jgi:ribosomal protein L37AE/L43A